MFARLSLKRIIQPQLNHRASTIRHSSSGCIYGRSESYPQQQPLLYLRTKNNVTLTTNFPCPNQSLPFPSSAIMQSLIQDIYFPGLVSNALTEVTDSNEDSYSCLSVLKQRRKKMKKHKYKKWRKRMRFVRKAHGR